MAANSRMRRRVAVATFVLVVTSFTTLIMADVLWGMPMLGWNGVVLVLYAILFMLLSFGCAQAFFGFCVRFQSRRREGIEGTLPDDEVPAVPLAPTAVVVPIYNEDVRRVYAGLKAMYRSVEKTGRLEHFDFFILSDSTDIDKWIEEEVGWVNLNNELGARGRLFYRKRRVNVNGKAGNVADFCRRWGKRYRYMIVLDADSIMTGSTMVRMVALMERNPNVGLLQTVPVLAGGESLFARIIQFGAGLYGRVFAAGLNFWQQSEGNYWGHNAIVRTAAFIQHCALPKLPGREPFGGRILSHDFVEAALLRRAGWEVWLAPELHGSFEEGPPTLIDSAMRDRRWCQGNLQHFWLLFAKGFHPVSRLHMMMGILGYSASLIWLLFLLVGTLLIVGFDRTGLTWVPAPGFATALGVSSEVETGVLLGITALMLFGPKLLGGIDAMLEQGGTRKFGGTFRMWVSMFLESVFSALLAPILMLFHAKFVVMTVFGRGVRWVTQNRGDGAGTVWRDAWSAHAWQTLFGLVWGGVVWFFSPDLLPWFLPVLLGMIVSIPFSVWTSRNCLGAFAKRRGWFVTPEESGEPPELKATRVATEREHAQPAPRMGELDEEKGLLRAVLDPFVNAVHICLLRERSGQAEEIRRDFEANREKLLMEGPGALGRKEKLTLLSDPESLEWLHHELWAREPGKLSPWWRLALRFHRLVHPAA